MYKLYWFIYLFFFTFCDLYLYIVCHSFLFRISHCNIGPSHSITLSFVHGCVCSFISEFYSRLSIRARTYIRAKKNSFRYNPSFSHLTFLSQLLAHSLVRQNEPPLSRSFSRAHSSSAEINLMFSRISGLLISPSLIYRRRPCISTHKRGREPSSPHVPLTFVFRATPKRVSLGFPWFSVPPVSIWLDDFRSLRGDYRSCQRIIGHVREKRNRSG